MRKRTISILVFELSSNALVRTYPIAKTLSRHFNIEIIGVLGGKEIYNPYKEEFEFKVIEKSREKGRLFGYFVTIKNVIKAIDGDIIYAFKPKLFSFGVGLLAKIFLKLPLVLDIEDLETANWVDKSVFSKVKLTFSRFDSNNEFINYLLEKFIPFADEKVVVSNFLQNKFGGTKIYHGADTYAFDPCRVGKSEARRKLGLDDEAKYILFSGVPREHKGLEELIKSITNIKLKNLRLLLVGGNERNSYFKRLISLGRECIHSFGPRPHSEMVKFLAAADLVVLPQRKTLFSKAQVPGKVFEAMAMAKPIISTNVSDLPEILDGCGIIIKSSLDTVLLEKQIEMLLGDPAESSLIGARARKKCISQYSLDAMEKKIVPIFERLIN